MGRHQRLLSHHILHVVEPENPQGFVAAFLAHNIHIERQNSRGIRHLQEEIIYRIILEFFETSKSAGMSNVDLEELAKFREEWKKEVERKKNPQPEPGPSKPRLQPIVEYDISEASSSGTATPGPSSETISGTPSALATTSGYFNASGVPSAVRNALAIYTRAVQHEQSGQLDTALSLYRTAFRMEPNVDRAYHTQELLASINAAQTKDVSDSKGGENIDQLAKTLQRAISIKSGAREDAGGVVTGTLASLLESFPHDLVFEPEDEKQPMHLNILPEELLIMIIRKLDHTSIERLAAVSRKTRVLTLDPGIWRELVVLSYKPPQVPSLESMVSVVTQYQSDFRRVYIEHPRIRLDGVYIAVCHYVRPGLSENSWVNLSHLITYHRYLRFFPDGKVLSLLANEEAAPAQVIHTLKPSLRKKGLFIGTWKLSGSVVTISNLIDASGRFPIPPISTPGSDEPFARYSFSMILSLRSRPLGRWNKLELTAYNSVDLENGNTTPLGLRHERPFWFSRVKSFPPF
ncbi:hypothetical protein MVEN_00986800 [Mycena venus]|uniref:F-box domain-containing protein n=1 Tax=Mycena venus TaxID=2733690 RepID=A0A8H7D213_9AGAR|nr:hypothetical protein MVEN_00986800 [Mycena venus]